MTDGVAVTGCNTGDITLGTDQSTQVRVSVENTRSVSVRATVEIATDTALGAVTWSGIGYIPAESSNTVPVTIDVTPSNRDVLLGNTVGLEATVAAVEETG